MRQICQFWLGSQKHTLQGLCHPSHGEQEQMPMRKSTTLLWIGRGVSTMLQRMQRRWHGASSHNPLQMWQWERIPLLFPVWDLGPAVQSLCKPGDVHRNSCQSCHDKIACFGERGGKPVACVQCKTGTMIDVVSTRCKGCALYIVLQPPFLCAFCRPDSQPYTKTAEHAVRQRLESSFPDVHWVHDRTVDTKSQCTRKRPDFLTYATQGDKAWAVLVECDEHQHRYNTCEEKRMMEVSQDIGDWKTGLPAVWIRFNPHTYYQDGKRVTVDMEDRLMCLEETIKKVLATPAPAGVSVHWLYYNDAYQTCSTLSFGDGN